MYFLLLILFKKILVMQRHKLDKKVEANVFVLCGIKANLITFITEANLLFPASPT